MKKPDPLTEIEVGVRGDTAISLGRAGQKLERAIAELIAFEQRGGTDAEKRKQLVHAAAAALWAYVVQKEAIGITDHQGLEESYGVTREMWNRMGARTSTAVVERRPWERHRSEENGT